MTMGGAQSKTATRRVAVIGLIGLITTAILYIIGRAIVRTSSYSTVGLFGQTTYTGVISLKSLLATVALALAVVQVGLALWMYGKLPLGRAPRQVAITHRVTGILAVIVTLPVALHCAIAYGVQLSTPRVLIHSIAGCFFYGAFLAKVLLVHSRKLPGWALPVAGGILAVLIAVLWYTSALWYYNGFTLP
jgi:Family of unknown function (DUF6529)